MNFTIYSKDGCKYCTKAKQLLEYSNQKFVVYNLDKHFTKDQFHEEFGHGKGFPQVTVDGKKLGGCMETLQYLQEKKLI
tara:strand:- start:1370 stop:1606 length:237 start_codon:yes stop_codon:yes gene_type:complete